MSKLTAKQQRFVDEYLIDLNATQAAIRAGYSEKTAKDIGCQNLAKLNISEAIERALQSRSERTQIDADWLLKRLADEAVADVADIIEESTGALKPIHEWPEIWRTGLVAGVDVSSEYEMVDGKKEQTAFVSKVRLSDRVKRLELIGKHIGVSAFQTVHKHEGSITHEHTHESVSDTAAWVDRLIGNGEAKQAKEPVSH